MNITELLNFTKQQGASDLHLSSGIPPTIRLHGTLRKLKMDPLTKKDMHTMIHDLMSDSQRIKFEQDFELDFSVSIPGVARFRVNVFRQERGESAAFRIIPSECPTSIN
jgi:twitching motility protein PilT